MSRGSRPGGYPFLFDSDASLTDMLTLGPKLNTAEPREAWPALIKACSEARYRPRDGILGAAQRAHLQRRLRSAHNDYLRTYCDTGLVAASS